MFIRSHRVHSIDVARSVVCLCVLATLIYCAKTAEPIEMPFGRMPYSCGPRNHVSDGSRDPPQKGAILRVVRPTEKH